MILQMLLSIREIKKAYPFIDNKDIDIVMKIKKPISQIQYVIANGKPRPKKVWLKTDIESLF